VAFYVLDGFKSISNTILTMHRCLLITNVLIHLWLSAGKNGSLILASGSVGLCCSCKTCFSSHSLSWETCS